MKYPIQRYKTSLVLAFAADDNQIISAPVNLNGRLRRATIVVPNLDSTNTADLSILDSDGYAAYTKTGMAKSATSNNTGLDVALGGNHTLVIDTSGAQTADRTFTIVLLIDRGA